MVLRSIDNAMLDLGVSSGMCCAAWGEAALYNNTLGIMGTLGAGMGFFLNSFRYSETGHGHYYNLLIAGTGLLVAAGSHYEDNHTIMIAEGIGSLACFARSYELWKENKPANRKAQEFLS